MGPDSFHNRAVVEECKNHGDHVVEDEGEQDEAFMVHVVGQVVIGASEQHSLCCISSPDS